MELRFRDDFEETLLDWLTRERRAVTGQGDLGLEVLASPHRNSPFLTVAEWLEQSRDGLPWRVVKLLAVLEEDASAPFWRDVLQRERERWSGELERRLEGSERVAVLGLPLSAARERRGDLVEMSEIGPLRRGDLLEETSSGESGVRFPYLARPYVAWPRLRDVGYSAEELRRRWDLYCENHRVADHLREALFQHFCDEALIDGRRDLLLTSAWRLEMFR